ncbi:MAG TPA: GvpL/GvpF family gas vesicle protein [Pyrinomonadaceae bacterium]|nr:GvpL/GvpF family gas vesicle protein [Pyrinomonadaceae bacterium]
MSARESKKREDGRGLYVYCVGEGAALSELFEGDLPPAIEAENGLKIIGAGDLAAIVSAVPLVDYGEEALLSRLGDATWTALRAMRHERVVEHFARRASVVPLRFGTIYLERARVEQMLTEKRDDLRSIIERLRGREEWGLNLTRDRAQLLENIVSLSPRLRELTERAEGSSPGQSYLVRKKIDALRETEGRAETKRVIAEIERELLGQAEGAARLRVLKDEANEHGEVVAKFAFLVDGASFDRFREAAERLAREYEPSGFRLELTGPWPAYNFAASGRN